MAHFSIFSVFVPANPLGAWFAGAPQQFYRNCLSLELSFSPFSLQCRRTRTSMKQTLRKNQAKHEWTMQAVIISWSFTIMKQTKKILFNNSFLQIIHYGICKFLWQDNVMSTITCSFSVTCLHNCCLSLYTSMFCTYLMNKLFMFYYMCSEFNVCVSVSCHSPAGNSNLTVVLCFQCCSFCSTETTGLLKNYSCQQACANALD